MIPLTACPKGSCSQGSEERIELMAPLTILTVLYQDSPKALAPGYRVCLKCAIGESCTLDRQVRPRARSTGQAAEYLILVRGSTLTNMTHTSAILHRH